MPGEEVKIKCPDGQFMAYVARPAGGAKAPGVVVAQEIFGVNAGMREICDWLAANGFVACCPDLFWRQEPGIQLTDKTEGEWKRAFELYQGFNVPKGVADLAVAVAWLRADDQSNGMAGGVGYCLGGLLAYLMATRTNSDASVGYYGVGIEKMLDEARKISQPLMLHIAEGDQFVPKEAQDAVKAGLAGNANVTIHSYPGVDHAFARPDGQPYDKAAAELANSRTLAFFKTHLS